MHYFLEGSEQAQQGLPHRLTAVHQLQSLPIVVQPMASENWRYGMVWYGMVLVWYSMVWYGMVWYWYGIGIGMVWYGMVSLSMVATHKYRFALSVAFKPVEWRVW